MTTSDAIGTIQAIRDTYATKPIETSWFRSFFAKPPAPPTPKPGAYAWLTLADLLDEQFEPQQVADAHPIPTDTDYVAELNELGRVLRWVEQAGTVAQFEDRLAELLLGMAYMAAEHIRANNNNYPSNSISAKIWMDGASLRGFCQTLTDYKLRQDDRHKAIDAAYYKARITLAIMGHYPSEVGPDMVQVGRLYEQCDDAEMAETFYQPVVNDFASFLADYEAWPAVNPANYNEDSDDVGPLGDNERLTLQALIEACEGLIRVGVYGNNSDLIRRAEAVLRKHTFD
ncbi:hypothetical protein [Fibrella aquatilis]|uniref:Uncharacterized protein n=1 Tax=Fibrella aquatilis TaxID=2817059 RepID=A0A939G5B4_9BACT|nr:hypothetical protein [Fibrella aquatilis]MBO0932404.1 hypothetical protein [Fibrella aquatilis]